MEKQITQVEAQNAILELSQELDLANVRVRLAQDRIGFTRGELGAAIQAWQQQTDRLSPEERRQREVRHHLASEQARRIANPKIAGRRAKAFVQKQMRNGPHRGAYPASQQHGVVDPLTGRVRLPSERRGI
jgi:hypothetical protein